MVTTAMHPAGKSQLLIRVGGSDFATGMSFVHCAPPNSVYHQGHREERNTVLLACLAVDRQNKSPFAIALGDWFPLGTYLLTSKASPNDSKIVIVVIIIVIGEADLLLHIGGIIAQTVFLDRVLVAASSNCKTDAIP
jgi:hypothetical protein